MRKKFTLVFVLMFFYLAIGQDNNRKFENANTAYNAGQFEKAVLIYKEILESGEHSAALFFNMANCYYRLNNVAESIFFFEKAKQLNPLDDDIKVNSTFAQNMAIDAVEVLPKSQITKFQEDLFGLFKQDGWAIFSVFLSWLLVVFCILYLRNKIPLLKRIFFVFTILIGLLLVSSVSILFIKSTNEAATTYGILFNEKIEVWTEPNSRAEGLFFIHEGTKVQMLDVLQEWQKIRIANGSEGWIKGGKVRSLKSFK